VGDTSIDLPEANVIIQISSQFGSRSVPPSALRFPLLSFSPLHIIIYTCQQFVQPFRFFIIIIFSTSSQVSSSQPATHVLPYLLTYSLTYLLTIAHSTTLDRRQEAQRLGRILRPKQTADEGFNAFFYTLVCSDTVVRGCGEERKGKGKGFWGVRVRLWFLLWLLRAPPPVVLTLAHTSTHDA